MVGTRRFALVAMLTLGGPAALPAGAPTAAMPPVTEAFVVPASPEPIPGLAADALAGIRAAALSARIAFLASPGLEGRGLGSRGLEATADYVASELALAGVAPLQLSARTGAVERGYFQDVPLREVDDPGGEVTVERHAGGTSRSRTFTHGADCVFRGVEPQTITAPAVFAGYGIRTAAPPHDDYAALDVHGKIVLVRAGTPPGAEYGTGEMTARYASHDPEERWAAKLASAAKLGAAAVIAIEDTAWTTRLEEARDEASEPFFLPLESGTPPARTPLIVVSPAVAAASLGGDGLAGAPRELGGVTITVRATGRERVVAARNVLGSIQGSDATLRDEAVVLGAHIDHLGVLGGRIHPGADDNASGTAALLEIARAFAAMPQPPRRTLIFAFWTGEEEGKLGSGAYVRHPLWPLARTAVYVNLDMIGHPWLMEEIRTLVADSRLPNGEEFLAHVEPPDFAEPGLPPAPPAIAAALRRAAGATGMALHLDFTDGTSGGSDYRDFARAGVPFIRFFGNFFPAYHEPGDTPEALDPRQVERMARLAFATVWLLASG